MVRSFWPKTHTRSIIQPEPPFLLFLWDFQPFTPPYPFNPLVVHTPACVVEQAGYHTIPIAPVLIGQLDNIVGQTFFISPALRNLSLYGPVLTKCAAGAALGYAKLLPHKVDTFAATRRA